MEQNAMITKEEEKNNNNNLKEFWWENKLKTTKWKMGFKRTKIQQTH